jgi:hypothetical protein
MHQIQITLDAVAAAAMAPRQADPGLIIKTALTAALGGPVVRPWRLHRQQGRELMLLGYSAHDEAALALRRGLAEPAAQRALRNVLSSPLPEVIPAGTEVRWRIRLCPTLRVTPGAGRRHGERDAFLAAADAAGSDAGLARLDVYADYLRARLPGAELIDAHLDGFRLERMQREGVRVFPVADLYGNARITDWSALRAAMAAGIGRQRAYGCGFLRLEPAR